MYHKKLRFKKWFTGVKKQLCSYNRKFGENSKTRNLPYWDLTAPFWSAVVNVAKHDHVVIKVKFCEFFIFFETFFAKLVLLVVLSFISDCFINMSNTSLWWFQHKRRLYTWTSPGGQHQNQIDYIHCSQRWRNSIQAAKTRPGADCGSDHELFMTNSDLNWRK